MSIFTKQRHTDVESRLVVTMGEEGEGGEDWELELADAN